MIPPKWAEFFAQQRKTWTEQNLGRKLRALRQKPGARVVIGSQELVNFSSNDYLGLTSDMRIAEAAARAAGRYGWGTGASRLVTGTSNLHIELENEIARFRGTEAALTFGSGYQANLGVLSALVGPGDAVFSDTLNHASIVAGCRLSGAETNVIEHRAYDDLETELEINKSRGRRLVVTDSLFSIEGTTADIERLLKICEKHEALLVVDDAHGNAVLGKRGRGVADLQGVSAQVEVSTATFSKGLGSYGGFVACSREIRDFLVNRSRPFAFTTSLPIPLVAANLEALKIVASEGEQLRQKLAAMVRTLRTKLAAADFQPMGEHHVVPIVIGDEDQAVQYSEQLEGLGMMVHAMRFPTVAKGKATLRISVSAAHSDDDIYRLVNAMKSARDRVQGRNTGRMARRETRRPDIPRPADGSPVATDSNVVDIASLISQVADPQAVAAALRTPSGEFRALPPKTPTGEFKRPATDSNRIPPAPPPTRPPSDLTKVAPARKQTNVIAPPAAPAPAAEPGAAVEPPAQPAEASAPPADIAPPPPTPDAPAETPPPSPGDTLLPEGATPTTPPKPQPPAGPPPPPPSTEGNGGQAAADSAASTAGNAKTLVPELDALPPSEAPENYKGKTGKVRKTGHQRKTRTQKRD